MEPVRDQRALLSSFFNALMHQCCQQPVSQVSFVNCRFICFCMFTHETQVRCLFQQVECDRTEVKQRYMLQVTFGCCKSGETGPKCQMSRGPSRALFFNAKKHYLCWKHFFYCDLNFCAVSPPPPSSSSPGLTTSTLSLEGV